jgi:hypothetical protein
LLVPPFSPPRCRLLRGCVGHPRRADGHAPRCCPPRRPATRRARPRRRLPGAAGGSVPRPPSGASGRSDRSRSGEDHTAGGSPARGRQCAAARGSR